MAVDEAWKTIVRRQFGAAIEMLERAIRGCPEALWSDRSRRPEFWYVAYHTLFFLDLYLEPSVEAYAPPAPFTLSELDDTNLHPPRVYTRDELLAFLEHGRGRLHLAVAEMTEDEAGRRAGFPWVDVTRGEMFIYNLRHVQHHTAQLYLILRQQTDATPGWVQVAG